MTPEKREPPVSVRVEVLGPLRLVVEGRPVEVPGPKRRAVLALLAKAEGRVVATEHLLDSVWPSAPPESARAALHTHISRLRRHLGAAASRLEATGGGYRLVLDDGALDASVAKTLVERARQLAADDHETHAALQRAYALWQGDVLADLTQVQPLAAWAVALAELRRAIGDRLIRCALATGHTEEALEVAGEAAASDPLRETAVLLLMQALAAVGRAAEALRVGYDFRRRLREEAGLDPSGVLTQLERDIASSAAEGLPHPTLGAPGRLLSASGMLGRQSEAAALRRLLDSERMVTVVGPAGVGKTTLACTVARSYEPATVWPLAPVSEPAEIASTLADALELRVPRGDVLSACAALLRAGPRLLVVDNCEHLLAAAAHTVAVLLETCPQLTVLATSREPLRVAGERQCRLAPLPVPDAEAAADLGRVPSVELFVDRARRVRPSFAPDAGALRVVGEIVRRLDGLPLAIELAAGRLSALELADLHARLDRALDILGDPTPGADPRRQTLRATIEWSYQLLDHEERRLFRHLAVFPDGTDLTTAERVAEELALEADPASVLAQLVDASMLSAELGRQPRYRMLETVRAFALDRLRDRGEADEASRRLVRWAGDLAAWVAATAVTEREPDADAALRREIGNLRAAWQRALRLDQLDTAIAIVTCLADLSAWRDLSEIWRWAQDLADHPALPAHPRAAAALGAAAVTAWLQGEADRAERLAAASLDRAADDEDRWLAHSALATIRLFRGDAATAVEHARQAAACAPAPDSSYGIAALAAAYAGDMEQACTHHDRLTAIAGYPTLRAFAAYVEGEIANIKERPDEAEQHYARALELGRSSGATFVQGIAAVGLQAVRADAGRTADALRGYRDLIDYWERTGSWIQQWTTLRNLAELLHSLGHVEPARFLVAAADQAPDAPALGDHVRNGQTPASLALSTTIVSPLGTAAPSASRKRVLGVARESIGEALTSLEA